MKTFLTLMFAIVSVNAAEDEGKWQGDQYVNIGNVTEMENRWKFRIGDDINNNATFNESNSTL